MGSGQKITKGEGATLTKNFRNAISGGISFDDGSGNTLLGQVYDAQIFENMLKQTDCQAIRIYYGLTDSDTFCLVLVGVNSDGNDMADGDIFQYGSNCPPDCGDGSPFNS